MRQFPILAVFGSFIFLPGSALLAQQPPVPAPDQSLSPQQLQNLVAPIALYPDPLLSQIMVAATYPLEVVQAYQWAQRNPGLTGTALADAAKDQNWDPSVQALVVFPDVLKRLNDDVTWTTNLGNAFLAQQAEVMDAVQQLRQQAQQAGQLNSTPQETVSDVPQSSGPPAIEIEPADPDVMYVPVYNPAWIWGPAAYYPYPAWYWPARPVGGLFFSFGAGIRVGAFFGGGWGGWGGWGWHPGWGGRTVIVNNTFIHRYNFNSVHVTQLHGTNNWQHDSFHRQGVPYARPEVANHFQAPVRDNLRPGVTQQARGNPQQEAERIGNRAVPQNNGRSGVFGHVENGQAAHINSDHGYSSMGSSRSGGSSAPPPPRNTGGGGGAPRGGGAAGGGGRKGK